MARTSTHRGKNGSAIHNMHAFKNKDKNIFLYWKAKYNGIEINGKTIEEREIDFYTKVFTSMLEEQNDKYRAKRNYDRVKTMKDIYKSKRYKPTEEIVQYGGVHDKLPDKETYIKMVKEYYTAKEKLGKGYVVVLSSASHFDETTPHTHFREVWLYKDDKGITRIGQEEALKRAGIELPKPNEPEGRYNNRMMTYTKMCREKWQDICEAYGYPVERTPKPVKKRHQTVKEYQDEASSKYFNAREDDLNAREVTLRQQEAYIRLEIQKLSQERSEALEVISKCKTLAEELEDERREKRLRELQQLEDRINSQTNSDDYNFHR